MKMKHKILAEFLIPFSFFNTFLEVQFVGIYYAIKQFKMHLFISAIKRVSRQRRHNIFDINMLSSNATEIIVSIFQNESLFSLASVLLIKKIF